MGQRIERYFWHEKENLLKIETKAQELNERLFLYHQVLMNEPQIFSLNQKETLVSRDKLIPKGTQEIVLDGKWLM